MGDPTHPSSPRLLSSGFVGFPRPAEVREVWRGARAWDAQLAAPAKWLGSITVVFTKLPPLFLVAFLCLCPGLYRTELLCPPFSLAEERFLTWLSETMWRGEKETQGLVQPDWKGGKIS